MNVVLGLRDAGPGATGVGGKATGLARLIAAGLPVPDGFVVPHAAFIAVVGELPAADEWQPGAFDASAAGALAVAPPHPLSAVAVRAETADIPPALAAEVATRASALATALAVRSSVSIEDTASGAAAGVLSSRLAVAPGAIWPAIRAVWASACTPLVVEYARQRGVTALEVAVIVQPFVDGRAITIYTRPPGQPGTDEVWIEPAGGDVVRVARTAADPRVVLALAAEAAIGASRGADVELIERPGGDLVVVQARPIVHPARVVRVPPPPALLAPLIADTARTWRLDVEHNPEPLSVAQAGLVAAVDAAGVAPWRMCTVAGYLYTANEPPADLTLPTSAKLLKERFVALEGAMRRAIEGAGNHPTVRQAMAAYLMFYAVWASELAPMLEIARLGASATSGSPIARAIGDTAAGVITRDDLLVRIGDMALAWDVAAPTLREQPWVIDAAIASAQPAAPRGGAARPDIGTDAPASPSPADPPIPRAAPPGSSAPPTLASLALELSEQDDVWFARAQAMVRRALIAAGARLGIGDDVFWLPLDELDGELDPVAAAARAAAARAARDRAGAWDMPLVAGETVDRSHPVDGPGPDCRRGVGHGHAIGTVRRLDGAAVVTPGTIVVARAITPALALLVHGATALVSETGGILGHGAAIARELGIPFVVGCDAARDLADGDRVEVDGEAGVVRRLDT